MTRQQTTKAVVLRTVEYGDKDIIVTLFGEETGKLGAIAKNARASKRRFGGGLQPLRVLRAHLVQRPNQDLARLDSIDVVEDFSDIESDYNRITAGSYATELVRETTVELDPVPRLFRVLVQYFHGLNRADGPFEITQLLHQFEYQVLLALGASPALSECLRCGTPTGEMLKIHALRTGEGVLCPDCRRTGDQTGVLAPVTHRLLMFFAGRREDWPEAVEPAAMRQARRFLEAAIERVTEKPLKSRHALEPLFDAVDSS